MTSLTMNQIQHNYKERKQKAGWKRIQIWKLDDTNERVRERIKSGAKLANQTKHDKELIDELSAYTHAMLQDIPL
jgi:hypothetical protein